MIGLAMMLAAVSADKPHTYKLIGGPTNKVYRNLRQCELARRAANKRYHDQIKQARANGKRLSYRWVIEPVCGPW